MRKACHECGHDWERIFMEPIEEYGHIIWLCPDCWEDLNANQDRSWHSRT
jgi:hypothetical protein